ncbi:MAG: nuclear transport factor 2 family protein [Pseudomonadota bacterium]
MSDTLQAAKRAVLTLQRAFDAAAPDALAHVLDAHCAEGFLWRGMHPFYEQRGAEAVVSVFWRPLREAFSGLQRRQDVFLAGRNDVTDDGAVWVASMGHFMGLFDRPWLGIPATGKLAFLRYAEFHCVRDGAITESALFCDVLSVMHQAGHYPLPPPTGADFIHPGPRTHDGVQFDPQPEAEGRETLALVNRMIDDLSQLNLSGNDECPPEVLARTWHEDFVWFGPTGIGATYTIERYQKQHQFPFRKNLRDKQYNGHVTRFAEGHYAAFFGWANLTNTPTGGFLGLPGNDVRADMRVVDVYRREGDKLAENWIFIDILHYLSMQGLDVLARLQELLPSSGRS